MPNEGPTTVGSIVGKLSMDRAVWLADKEKTKADAREIGALNPTVRVDMDTAAALAKLEALRAAAERAGAVGPAGPSQLAPAGPSAATSVKVDALANAERRLAAAISASDSATARAIVAEMKLEESRTKHGRSAAQIAAAELAAAEAIKRADAAAERAVVAEAALAVAQEKAAQAALKQAAAEDVAAGSTAKANEANKTTPKHLGLITAAVALLLPLMVPVAAGAVGIAAGLTMMGVSGVLAVVGIRREMQQGTAAGKAYSDGLLALRQDMNLLGQTSALNMLRSFRQVVGDTAGAMPMLNRQVGEFTGILGRSGGNLFAGSINGLRVLEPLLLTAGVYVERLTRQFNEWTQNGGLEKFGNYALAVLPQVEDVLGSLSSAIMHILEALAPLGQIGMVVLTGISEGIKLIPVDVLGAMIGALTWGMLAFKGWGFIAPMLAKIATSMGAVGAATTIATGPIGWIVAGVAALVAVLSVAIITTQNATDATANYTSAVQADTGAIGDNVKASAAKALQDAGAYEAATRLGISTALVTKATLGDTAAKKELNAELKVQEDRLKKTADASAGASGEDLKRAQAIDLLRGQVSGQNAGIQGSIDAYNVLQEALGKTTISTDEQRAAVEANAKAAGVSVQAYLGAMSSQGDAQAQIERTTATMYLQNDAAGLLKQTLDLLNGKTISAAQAQNQFDSQIANMSKHVNAAGKTINRADTLLTGMTASAVKNRGELINLTSAAEANAQAFRDNGGSVEATRQKLIDMKKEIVENAVKHGENRKQVQAFIDTIFKIPDKIPPTKIEVDTSSAKSQIDSFAAAANKTLDSLQRRLQGLHGTTESTQPEGGLKGGFANGGTIGHLAGGGGTVSGSGNASSDTAGLYRLANTEEVIGNQFGQADRWRGLLKQINAGVVPSLPSSGSSHGAPDNGLLRELLKRITPGGNVIVNPAPGMSESTIGRIAADALNSKMRASA